MLLLASKIQGEREQFFPIHELARELNLSFHFLTKVLQVLTDAELLKSYRGPKGGVGFQRDVNSIKLIDIVDATDGLEVFDRCVLGLPACNDRSPCPLHDKWKKQREQIKTLFQKTSIRSLSRNLHGTRLAD